MESESPRRITVSASGAIATQQQIPTLEGWSIHKDDYMRVFYFNGISQQSTWAKPCNPAFITEAPDGVALEPLIVEQHRQRYFADRCVDLQKCGLLPVKAEASVSVAKLYMMGKRANVSVLDFDAHIISTLSSMDPSDTMLVGPISGSNVDKLRSRWIPMPPNDSHPATLAARPVSLARLSDQGKDIVAKYAAKRKIQHSRPSKLAKVSPVRKGSGLASVAKSTGADASDPGDASLMMVRDDTMPVSHEPLPESSPGLGFVDTGSELGPDTLVLLRENARLSSDIAGYNEELERWQARAVGHRRLAEALKEDKEKLLHELHLQQLAFDGLEKELVALHSIMVGSGGAELEKLRAENRQLTGDAEAALAIAEGLESRNSGLRDDLAVVAERLKLANTALVELRGFGLEDLPTPGTVIGVSAGSLTMKLQAEISNMREKLAVFSSVSTEIEGGSSMETSLRRQLNRLLTDREEKLLQIAVLSADLETTKHLLAEETARGNSSLAALKATEDAMSGLAGRTIDFPEPRSAIESLRKQLQRANDVISQFKSKCDMLASGKGEMLGQVKFLNSKLKEAQETVLGAEEERLAAVQLLEQHATRLRGGDSKFPTVSSLGGRIGLGDDYRQLAVLKAQLQDHYNKLRTTWREEMKLVGRSEVDRMREERDAAVNELVTVKAELQLHASEIQDLKYREAKFGQALPPPAARLVSCRLIILLWDKVTRKKIVVAWRKWIQSVCTTAAIKSTWHLTSMLSSCNALWAILKAWRIRMLAAGFHRLMQARFTKRMDKAVCQFQKMMATNRIGWLLGNARIRQLHHAMAKWRHLVVNAEAKAMHGDLRKEKREVGVLRRKLLNQLGSETTDFSIK